MPATRKPVKSAFQEPLALRASKWSGRLLIFALLLFSPWIYGMVTWSQQMLLIPWVSAIIACTVSTAFLSRDFTLPRNPLVVCLLLLLAMVVVQVMPLPQFIHQLVAPGAKFEQQVLAQAAEYLLLEPSDTQLLEAAQSLTPNHQSLSIHPLQTRASLVGLTAAVALLICSFLLFSDRTSRFALLVLMSAIGTVQGILGILQNISWNNWSLLEMPVEGYFATFVSRNSAPQFLAVGIGCTIALLIHRLNKKRRQDRYSQRYHATTPLGRVRNYFEDAVREVDATLIVIGCCFVLQLVAVVGAASRGGVASMFVALAATFVMIIGRNRQISVAGISFLGLATVISLVFLDSLELNDALADRIESMGLETPLRIDIWKMAISQSQFWLTGSGLGTFHFALLPNNSVCQYWIYHAESIYVELFSEFGVVGIALAIVGLAWLATRVFLKKSTATITTWPAAIYCLCAVGLHSFVDFSLIIPAIFISLCVLLGAYIRESKDQAQKEKLHSDQSSGKLWYCLMATGLLALLLQGYLPLRGFAQAEKLSLSDSTQAVNPKPLEIATDELDLTHSEVIMQLSKRKVEAIESYLQLATRWPDSLGKEQKESYSQLEYAASIMRSNDLKRSTDSQAWQELAEAWNKDDALTRQIDACRESFRYSLKSASNLDWRSHWAILQTTIEPSLYSQALSYARLKLLTKSMPTLQQSTATCCLIAGERNIGLDFWKTSLSHFPMQAENLAPLIGSYLDIDELHLVLPESQIPYAGLAWNLNKKGNYKTSNQILDRLDLTNLIAEAQTLYDWQLAAWVTRVRGDREIHIQALQHVADLSPMDKTVRMQLAKAHEASGRLGEALMQMEQASRRTTLDADEQAYLLKLKQASQANPP
jgi:hypothetical protein